MSDLSALERETLAAIESAPDENTLEAARVAALGKKGSISALLATLGKLAPDERKAHGAARLVDLDSRDVARQARTVGLDDQLPDRGQDVGQRPQQRDRVGDGSCTPLTIVHPAGGRADG